MPQNNMSRIYDKDVFKMIVDAQSGINPNYDPQDVYGSFSRAVEEQSASLLEDYIADEIILTPEAEKMLPDFFEALAKSKYYRIKQSLELARDRYRILVIERHKAKVLAEHRRNEKKKFFEQKQFVILDKKKEAAKLSSEDLLIIFSALNEPHSYSTKKMHDKLRSLVMLKIEKTLKGEIPADDYFVQLTRVFDTYQQKNRVEQKIEKGSIKTDKTATMPITQEQKKNKRSHRQQDKIEIRQTHKSEENRKQPVVLSEETKVAVSVSSGNNATVSSGKQAKNQANESRAAVRIDNPSTDNNNAGWWSRILERKKEKTSVFTKTWKWAKRAAVVAGLALVGCFAGKTISSLMEKPVKDTKQNNTENVVKRQDPAKQQIQRQTDKEKEIADFSKEREALEKAYKNKFDTSLKIILGEKARDQLYQKIDQLMQNGKIEYQDGTTREWYAHAFTMYNQLAPNSGENKAIKALLAGKDIDKAYINSLVIKAGRSGSGIQATGTYSAFDHASKELQQQHIENRKAVRQAESALVKAKSQQSR